MKHIKLPLDPFLNFTCFRLQPEGITDADELNKLNESFLEEINRDGKLFLTHTRIGELFTLRMIIGQTYVEEQNVDLALEEIAAAAELTLKNSP